MHQIEIKHLELIQIIADTENLTRAAKRLSISQPALSRRLMDIEDRLGSRLFYRSKKRMILTPEGDRMLESARTILKELEKAELDISKIVNGETGTLRIGVSCIFCFQWLPTIISDFQKQYPKVDLAISSCQDYSEELKVNKFDMVLTATPIIGEEFIIINLFEDEMVAVMSPNHPLSLKRFLAHHDLMETKIIVSSKMSLQRFSHFLNPDEPVELEPAMCIDQPNAIIELVKAGLGISMVPKWAVRSYLEEGWLAAVPLGEQGIHPVWKIIYLKSRTLLDFQQKFIDLLLKQALRKSDLFILPLFEGTQPSAGPDQNE